MFARNAILLSETLRRKGGHLRGTSGKQRVSTTGCTVDMTKLNAAAIQTGEQAEGTNLSARAVQLQFTGERSEKIGDLESQVWLEPKFSQQIGKIG